MSFVFSSEDALLVALRTARIRPLRGSTFRFWREDDGAIGVDLEKICSPSELQALRELGAKPAKTPAGAQQSRSFIEVIRPRAAADAANPSYDPTNIIFLAGEEKTMLELAGELLRLGCDRQSHSLQQTHTHPTPRALIRAHHPPYYTIASALERSARVRAFTPVTGTNARVFIELGFEHPLAESISVPEGELRLLTREGELLAVGDGPWTELYSALDVVLPEPRAAITPLAQEKKLEVRLRLARAARTESPTLWVLRENGVETVDRMLASLPEEVVSRFLYAVGRPAPDAPPIVLLRTRAGKGDPSVDVPGEAYASLLSLPNIFVPLGTAIEPPLRREKLRSLFAPSAEEIVWLVPRGEQEFTVERIKDSAFGPLSDWVEYVAHSSAAALEPWIRGMTFKFERFQSIGAEWSEAPKPKEKEPPKPAAAEPRAPAPPPKPKRVSPARQQATAAVSDVDEAPTGPTLTVDQAALARLEEEFVALEVPLDAPERVRAWQAIGAGYTVLNDLNEGGLCFAHAVWEGDPESGHAAVHAWLNAELRAGEPDALVRDALNTDTPRRIHVRRAAVLAIAAASIGGGANVSEAVRSRRAELQIWLEKNDAQLDTRTAWLANVALAHLAGGDPLHLARTRDRLLGRIHSGLSLERDVPRFLRYLGGGKPRAGVHVDQLIAGLENFLARTLNSARKRRPVEAPEALTRAYSFLEFAYGFARLGRPERARALRTSALAEIPAKDAIHNFLREAYTERIDQALEARPLDTPLSQKLGAALGKLDSFSRYKVDRLRKGSRVLEPVERLEDTFGAFIHGERADLAQLRTLTDPDQLTAELTHLLQEQEQHSPEDRARTLDGLMDFYARVPGHARFLLERTLPMLDTVAEARRAILYEEALAVAGTLGETALVRRILTLLTALVGRLKPEESATVAAEIGRSLRGLRRAGLGDRYSEFLELLAKKITDDRLDARVQIAAALGFLGDQTRARPILLDAQRQLEASFKNLRDHQPLTPQLRAIRALANAWSQGSEADAVRGVSRLEPLYLQISDSYNTNSHFCLSVIEMVDAIVLGYAGEDLALGDRGRRFLDEDEHLVRRRMFRDLAQKEGPS